MGPQESDPPHCAQAQGDPAPDSESIYPKGLEPSVDERIKTRRQYLKKALDYINDGHEWIVDYILTHHQLREMLYDPESNMHLRLHIDDFSYLSIVIASKADKPTAPKLNKSNARERTIRRRYQPENFSPEVGKKIQQHIKDYADYLRHEHPDMQGGIASTELTKIIVEQRTEQDPFKPNAPYVYIGVGLLDTNDLGEKGLMMAGVHETFFGELRRFGRVLADHYKVPIDTSYESAYSYDARFQ